MREDIAAREKLQSARNDWDNRNWPENLVMVICGRVANGDSLAAIAEDECFVAASFHTLRDCLVTQKVGERDGTSD